MVWVKVESWDQCEWSSECGPRLSGNWCLLVKKLYGRICFVVCNVFSSVLENFVLPSGLIYH